MNIGIYKDLDIDAYHRGAGLSSSGINLLLKCPKRYWYQYLSGKYTRKETPDFLFGSAVHTAVLEPHIDLNALYPTLKDEKRDAIKQIIENVHELDITKAQLHDGHIEHSLFWNQGDVLCKTRPDFFNEKCVIEIKTTRSAEKYDFARSIYNYGYHVQAALQLDGIEAVTGIRPAYFVFICIEKKAPFVTAEYLLGESDIQEGRRLYQQGINIYRQCLAANRWHGYNDGLQEINLPTWSKSTNTNEVEDEHYSES